MIDNQFTLGFLSFVLLFSSCSLFEQNDFIKTEEIGKVKGKEIIYSLYQTGVDNYRYEIQLIENSDTTELITTFLNDGTADNSKFELQQIDSKITIKANKPLGKQSIKVRDLTYILEGLQF